jgi:hypothetical protein
MICERCQGKGGFIYHLYGLPQLFPCPDCEGSGIGYCCDGLQCDGSGEDGRGKPVDSEAVVALPAIGKGSADVEEH